MLADAARLHRVINKDDLPTIRDSLNNPGPYRPETTLPTKLVKKILNLEFTEMSEITAEEFLAPQPGRPVPHQTPITDISLWVQKYASMAAILSARFPAKAPELFAYLSQIVRAARNYEGNRWVSYDRQFRREALAKKNLDWSSPNHRLYNEAFTGWARSISRCQYCLQDDHHSDACPQNPNLNPMFNLLQDMASASNRLAGPVNPSRRLPTPNPQGSGSRESCKRYNRGRCPDSAATCRYRHACLDCQGGHPFFNCPRLQESGRSRSPMIRRIPPGPRPN